MLSEPVNHAPFHHTMRQELRHMLTVERKRSQGHHHHHHHRKGKKKGGAAADGTARTGAAKVESKVKVTVTSSDDNVRSPPRNVSFAPDTKLGQRKSFYYRMIARLLVASGHSHCHKQLILYCARKTTTVHDDYRTCT